MRTCRVCRGMKDLQSPASFGAVLVLVQQAAGIHLPEAPRTRMQVTAACGVWNSALSPERLLTRSSSSLVMLTRPGALRLVNFCQMPSSSTLDRQERA